MQELLGYEYWCMGNYSLQGPYSNSIFMSYTMFFSTWFPISGIISQHPTPFVSQAQESAPAHVFDLLNSPIFSAFGKSEATALFLDEHASILEKSWSEGAKILGV